MIGELLGAYRLLSELGAGGMGTVFLAEDGDGRPCALKVIHPHLLLKPRFRDRFVREARIGKLIRHKNVVATYGADTSLVDGKPALYLAMEYVEGQTLRALLAELGRVPETLCVHIAVEVAQALEAIHAAGVVHRDLKPENVLITKDHVVKVMDLGVARLEDETAGLSQTGAFVGSVLYGAPEQFHSEKPDARTDLYALGLLLYELATGRHPFAGDDVATVIHRQIHEKARPAAQLNPQLTPFFEQLVATLLEKDQNDRFPSAARLREVLEEGEDGAWWTERARRHPARRIRIPRETAIHGRDAELALLNERFEKGGVVWIEGEAGIGKTRLVDEFVARIGSEIHFLFGSYPPAGAATPTCAFAQAFADHADKAPPALVPSFAALLRGEPAPVPLDKDALQACFVHAMHALAAERPVVVLIDDLHFAPEEGRALFAALALGRGDRRILLLGAGRPGLPAEWLGGIEHTRLQVNRLGPKDLAHLLLDAFGSERLAQELSFRIGAKSDGNPFFTFEIIRGLREGQFIRRQPDGTWIKTQVIDDIEIPSTVLDLIQARIADLSDDERDLLEVASCCGYEFDPRLVGEVLGMPRIPALQKLGRLEKSHRLVRFVGASCVFDHHQVQEALYEGLALPLRQEYHLALAEALEEREHEDERAGAVAVELCRHFLASGRAKRVRPYLDVALDDLESRYANDAVVELAGRALAVDGLLAGAERLETLFRARAAADLLGRRDVELAILDEIVDLADTLGIERARARYEMGEHFFSLSEYELAKSRFFEALRMAGDDRRMAAQATGSLGGVAFGMGRYDEACQFHGKQLQLAREIGDRRIEAMASGNLGISLKNLGRLDEARERIERHLEISCDLGDRRGEATASGNLGLVHTITGQWNEAEECLKRCLRVSREIGLRYGVAAATGNLGNIAFHRGRAEEARDLHEQHVALCREIGDRRGEACASGNLGMAWIHLGYYEKGLGHLEKFLEIARAIGDKRGEALATGAIGKLRISLGDFEGAQECLEAALELAREIGAPQPESDALHDLGLLAEERGEKEQAAHLFHKALALRREIGHRAGEAAALLALGRVESADFFEDALRLARELDAAGVILVASAHLGEAATEYEERASCSDRMEARFLLWAKTRGDAHLEQARRLLAQLRDRAPEEHRADMIARVALHRELNEAEAR